jgi:pimeloyl-ACP methyl ester carboxylesterase
LYERYTVRCVSYPQDDRHTYADLEARVIQYLCDTGPAVVLAESFGGAVALMAALQRPDLVRRLVLVNTFAWYPRRLFIGLMGLIGPRLPMKPSHPATRRLRGLFFFGPRIPVVEQDVWWDLTADVPMRVYGHRFRLLAGLDLRPRLAEITVPTLIFTATNDWVVPTTAGRLLAKRISHAKAISLPTGHAAMIDPRVDVAQWLETPEYWRAARGG